MSHSQISTNSNSSVNVSGWNVFAATMMVIAGAFHMIAGLVALYKSDLYVVTQNNLLVFDFTQWGWIHVIVGLVLFVSSASLFVGGLWGRVVAIFFATLSAIASFSFIEAYPLWSIMIIVFDILIIYGVVVHGSEHAQSEV